MSLWQFVVWVNFEQSDTMRQRSTIQIYHHTTLLVLLMLMAWLLMPTHPAAMAQERHTAIITAQYKVNGVCEQCKKRIEDATYIKGVKHADWSIDTHILTLRYDTTKTSADVILKAVADAGHDNEKYTAPDDAYQAIPKCCRYRDKVPPHMN